MQTYLKNLFLDYNIPYATIMSEAAVIIAIIIVSAGLYFIIQRLGIQRLERYTAKNNKANLIQLLISHRVLRNLMLTIQALIIFILANLWLEPNGITTLFVKTLANILCLIFGTLTFFRLLDLFQTLISQTKVGKIIPTKGIMQAIKIILSIFMVIIIISILVGQSPGLIISGLGAMTAILMLVFKDPILGFVAGIQLSANNMLAIGDWIQMDKYGADGDVIDITLTTVKVQNFDKTIVLIPAYALISDSFINWQGMVNSGGRRIKRCIYVDMTSVHFLNSEEIERLSKIQLLKPYLTAKSNEINEYNQENNIDQTIKVNGRNLTNLGSFRAYLEAYLQANQRIHKSMTLMVRQRTPSEKGLPLEIYAFTNTTVWADYENIQSDIFDHIFAIIPEFGLRVHQSPSGNDVRELGLILQK